MGRARAILAIAIGIAIATATASSECAASAEPAYVMIVPLTTETSARLQAVSAVDARVVWVSGLEGTFGRSLDGGASWTLGKVSGAEELEFRDIHAVDGVTAYLLSSGPGAQSRIYKTDDGGASFRLQYENEDPEGFLDCFDFWDAAHGLVYGDSVKGRLVILTTSDGASWERVPVDVLPNAMPGEGGFAASGTCVATASETTAYIATGAGSARLLRTLDRGASWEAFDSPVVSSTPTSGLTALGFWNARVGLVAGGDVYSDASRDTVARTSNGGESFTLVFPPPFSGPVYGLAVASPAGLTVAVAVGPGGVSTSWDGGRSWNRLSDESYWSVTFGDDSVGFLVGPDGRAARIEFHP